MSHSPHPWELIGKTAMETNFIQHFWEQREKPGKASERNSLSRSLIRQHTQRGWEREWEEGPAPGPRIRAEKNQGLGTRGPWGAIDGVSPVEWHRISVLRMQILTAQYSLKVGEHLDGLCSYSRNE